jgi:hypothetical protein
VFAGLGTLGNTAPELRECFATSLAGIGIARRSCGRAAGDEALSAGARIDGYHAPHGAARENLGAVSAAGQRHQPKPGPARDNGGTPKIEVRDSITRDHRWTALHAARLCGQLESQLKRNDPKVEHRSQAMIAVFFAAAFLDALVNEVILDVIDPEVPAAHVANIPTDTATIAAFRRALNEPSTLEKYQKALTAAGKLPYTETRNPFKRAQLLLRFRNHLVHFKPKTRDIHVEHDFAARFKNAKIAENQQDIGLPWFPNRALGVGLADWACETSFQFGKSWWKRIGLRRDFDATFDQLAPY